MSTHCLIQISDIHTSADDAEVQSLLEKAAGAIAISGAGESKEVLVLMPGDLAFSGKADQYRALEAGLNRFKEVLHEKGLRCRFVFAAGNHDCDFEHPQQPVREILVSKAAQALCHDKAKPEIIASFLAVQEDFFKFCEKNGSALRNDGLVSVIKFDDLKVQVNSINTAWASELKETNTQPFILAELACLSPASGYLNVSIFHHPRSWLDPGIAGTFLKQIRDSSDFVFSGHEHASATYEVRYVSGEGQYYYESGAFREKRSPSQFRMIKLDTNAKTFEVTDFVWNSAAKVYESKSHGPLMLPQNAQANALGLQVDTKFLKKFLRDPGVSLKHTMKRELELDDIYEFPRLVEKSCITGDSIFSNIVENRAEFYDVLEKKKITLVMGNDRTGKTALCKTVYVDTFLTGALPVYLSGEDVRSDSPVVLKNLISDKIKEQYRDSSGIDHLQDQNTRTILIIDRFDQIALKPHEVGKVLSTLAGLFKSILLTADSTIEIQLLNDPRLGIPTDEINRFSIAPLSLQQRRNLISRWLSIGNTIRVDSNEAKIHFLDLYISNLISEFGIPNFPLFVLTYLQVAEAAGGSVNLDISSNAKLLETLVNISLLSVPNATIPQTTKLAYLRDLAFHLYCSAKQTLNVDEAIDFHKAYCSRLDVELSAGRVWGELLTAKMLSRDEEGRVGFRYPYFRSFFIATYLNFNASSAGIKEKIKQIVDGVHVTENASILATLSLYSSETWVLDELCSKVESTLTQFGPVGFLKFSKVVERVTKIDSFPLLPADHERNETELPAGVPDDTTERVALEISHAIRLIKVLGQLIRNSATTLEGTSKKRLAESIFAMAARILGVQATALEGGRDELLLYVYRRLREKSPGLADAKVKTEAVNRLAFIMSGIAVGLVDVVSKAIGDEFLDPTFRKIEGGDTDKLYEHFFLGIRIDWYKSFPQADLIRLFDETGGKGFAAFLLRYLGYRGMMFRAADLGAPILQEVSAKIGVDFKTLKLQLPTAIRNQRED